VCATRTGDRARFVASSAHMIPAEFPAFDLYAELEVSERASVETIQAAYRSLQLRNHPDRVGPDAGDRAARLNIARDWLTDVERRSRYDAHLAELRRALADEDGEAVADDQDDGDGEDADGEDTTDALDVAGRVAGGLSPLHLVRHHLRIDVRRLGRIWIAGLALLGAVALVPAIAAAPWLRIAIAVLTMLLLVTLALGLGRRTDGQAMSGLMARWIGMLLGWIALAVLAVEGIQAIVQLVGGESTPPGIAAITGPTLAVTALLSVFAVRRRHGPVETSVDQFLSMTPREFELAVGRILGRHGYRLTVTGGPGDLVADLTGTDPDGLPTVVQCKRYAPGHPVGSRDVQLLMALGVRHHKAERLVLVTTSDFTDPARDLADEHGVDLISGEELEDLTR
jgi:HJR/Mrr/RecB family endonuclease